MNLIRKVDIEASEEDQKARRHVWRTIHIYAHTVRPKHTERIKVEMTFQLIHLLSNSLETKRIYWCIRGNLQRHPTVRHKFTKLVG